MFCPHSGPVCQESCSMKGGFDDRSISFLLMGIDCIYPGYPEMLEKALAERTMLTIFIRKEMDRFTIRERLYESELFFAPHLDAHTSLELEKKISELSAFDVKKLDEEAVNLLKSTLPGITKLRIVILDYSDISEQLLGPIIQLLEHWASKLETLGIWAVLPFEIELSDTGKHTNLLGPLFAVINEKLTSLQNFTMAAPWFRAESLIDFSFIGRLKLFSTDISTKQFLDSLNHHGALQEKLPEVRLFNWYYFLGWSVLADKFKEKVLEVPDRLALKMSTLSLSYYEELDKSTLVHFPALKWCQMFPLLFEIPHLLDLLSVLTQLKYLKMFTSQPEFGSAFNSGTASQPLPALETLCIWVEIRSGCVSSRSHHFLAFFGPFDGRFPSLKWLHIVLLLNSEASPDRKEIFSMCMLQFAEQQLKGSIRMMFQIDTYSYAYEEEFNFTEGRNLEDWQYKEEMVRFAPGE